MKKFASGLFAALALIAATTLVNARQNTAHAQTSGRVFELRTYHTYEGKLEALKSRFRDHTIDIFKRHGMTSIGYWLPTDEPLKGKTLVYLLAFPSREAATKSWAAFRADPEWKKVSTASEANGKIVEKVDSVFLDPADFSQIQ